MTTDDDRAGQTDGWGRNNANVYSLSKRSEDSSLDIRLQDPRGCPSRQCSVDTI
jgi:hypothetical protein